MRCHKNLSFCSKASRYMTFMKSFLRTFKSLTFAFQSFTYLERDKILPVSSKCAKIILETILSSFMIKIPFASVNSIAITTALRMPWNEKKGITNQGCTNRCSLAAGLRGNGERMRKWGGNGEKLRKWREIDSLHFLILSLFPPSFSISSLSFHFLHQNVSHFVAKC